MNAVFVISVLLVVLFRPLSAAIRDIVQGRKTMTWSETTGTILASEVLREHRSPFKHEPIYLWASLVKYEYTIGDVTYQSHQLSRSTLDNPRHANLTVAKYPVGARVTVYYNPADPRHSVLEPGVPSRSVLTVALILAVLVSFGAWTVALITAPPLLDDGLLPIGDILSTNSCHVPSHLANNGIVRLLPL